MALTVAQLMKLHDDSKLSVLLSHTGTFKELDMSDSGGIIADHSLVKFMFEYSQLIPDGSSTSENLNVFFISIVNAINLSWISDSLPVKTKIIALIMELSIFDRPRFHSITRHHDTLALLDALYFLKMNGICHDRIFEMLLLTDKPHKLAAAVKMIVEITPLTNEIINALNNNKNAIKLAYTILNIFQCVPSPLVFFNKHIKVIQHHPKPLELSKGLSIASKNMELSAKEISFIYHHQDPITAGRVIFYINDKKASYLSSPKNMILFMQSSNALCTAKTLRILHQEKILNSTTRKFIQRFDLPFDFKKSIKYLSSHKLLTIDNLRLLISNESSTRFETVNIARTIKYCVKAKLSKKTVRDIFSRDVDAAFNIAKSIHYLKKAKALTQERINWLLNLPDTTYLLLFIKQLFDHQLLKKCDIEKINNPCIDLGIDLVLLSMSDMLSAENFNTLISDKYKWLLTKDAQTAFWSHVALHRPSGDKSDQIVNQDCYDHVLCLIEQAGVDNPADAVIDYIVDRVFLYQPEIVKQEFKEDSALLKVKLSEKMDTASGRKQQRVIGNSMHGLFTQSPSAATQAEQLVAARLVL